MQNHVDNASNNTNSNLIPDDMILISKKDATEIDTTLQFAAGVLLGLSAHVLSGHNDIVKGLVDRLINASNLIQISNGANIPEDSDYNQLKYSTEEIQKFQDLGIDA